MRTRPAVSSWALLVVSLSLGIAAPGAAQEQTGSLEGVVRDTSGGVLPGVTVEARNLDVGAAVGIPTDPTGTFRFPALSAGLYDVTASRDGFQAARFERVEVLLGQTKRLEFSLSVAGVAEAVRVSASSPLVDVKRNARDFSLRQDQIEFLPRGVDYASLVQFMPGTNAEPKLGGLSMDGASAPENRFIVDGVETSNLIDGLPGLTGYGMATVSADSVEELQVKSSGYSAEYGGTTGGVVNVLTKSGTNAWHGDARLWLGGGALEAGPRPNLRPSPTVENQAEYFTYPEDPHSMTQPGASLGGPLRLDRAWVFVSYQPTFEHLERTVTLSLDGSTVTRGQDFHQHLLTASQTLQLGPRLRTRASFNAAPVVAIGRLPAQAGTDAPGSNYDVNEHLTYWTTSGSADLLATSTLMVSGRVGYSYQNDHWDNVRSTPLFTFPVTNIGLLDVPADLQRVTGFRTDTSNFDVVKNRFSRLSTQVDATWYVRAWGEHELKGGIQADWLLNDVDSGNKANVAALYWNRSLGDVGGTYGYYRVYSNPIQPRRGTITAGSAEGRMAGVFLQDTWRVGHRLTINAGLRTEREEVPDYSVTGTDVPPILTFGFGRKLAPRLGAAYDLRGDGTWKLYGSWGVFYDAFKYQLSIAYGGIHAKRYLYTLDTYDWPTLLDDPGCPSACPGTLIDAWVVSLGRVPFDSGLDPMRSQEAVVGIEHQWKPELVLTARYVHKQLDRAVDDIGALDAEMNEVYAIGNPGYGVAQYAYAGVRLPKATRTYDTLELGARRPLTRRLGFSASYLWSRLYGNYSGLSQSDEDGRVTPNIGRVYDNAFVMFDEKGHPVYGPLATDRPHQVKATVVYQAPFRTNVGLLQFVGSGIPVSREIAVVPGRDYPVMYRGRLSDGRTPTLSQTDVFVQQDVGTWRGSRFSVGFSVTNLFNQDTVISKYSVETESGSAIDVSEEDFFAGRFDVHRAMAEQGIRTDAQFLQADAFQAPRTARILLKWTF